MAALVALAVPAAAQTGTSTVDLTIERGRVLSVSLDRRLVLKEVGQVVTGTLAEPLFAYDRVVVPAGTRVLGHVARFEPLPRMTRVRAGLAGDFSPQRRPEIRFDTLVFDEGREVAIDSVVTDVIERPARQVADRGASPREEAASDTILRTRARQEIVNARTEATRKAVDAWAAVKRPGRLERVKDALIRQLPYHPQFLSRGAALTAEIASPVSFGTVPAPERATAGARPAPESIVRARLLAPLDSAQTARGTRVEAVVTAPVFTSDGRLILHEGATVSGRVTAVRPARRFRRDGQLRFLFEHVRPLDQPPAEMLASLHSVETSDDDHVVVDEEGGARATSPKTRFVAPALALLALHGATGHHEHGAGAGAADVSVGAPVVRSGSLGGLGLGGYFGFGLIGAAISPVSQPVGVALAAIGAGRSVYSSVFGKGRDVVFPAGTLLELQLAPGPPEKP